MVLGEALCAKKMYRSLGFPDRRQNAVFSAITPIWGQHIETGEVYVKQMNWPVRPDE